LERVERLWKDDLSKETYRNALEWRLHARFAAAVQPVPDQYFPKDIVRPIPEEIFVDGGAFDGDTLRAAPWPFAKVLAFEPDPTNAALLRTVMGKNIQLHEVLLGSSTGSTRFAGKGTMASSRSDFGTMEIPVATLDDLTKQEHPTFVKLDVEGDELAALQGGLGMLKREKPVVAVCVYHRPEDLWRIPLFLVESLPSHAFYLRAHAWDGFELVAYAVPPARCQSHK
jgi:FkbM family methyltransferase